MTKKLAGVSQDQAQQVLDELAGRMQVTQIRSPVGYGARLAQRMKRGEFQLDAGIAVARRREAKRQRESAPKGAGTDTPTAIDATADGIPASVRATFERIRHRHVLAYNNSAAEARNAKAGGPEDDVG